MTVTAAPLPGRPLDEQGIDSLLASITAQYRRQLDDAGSALRARRPPPVLLRPSVDSPTPTKGQDVDTAPRPVASTVEQKRLESVETRPVSSALPRSQGRRRRPRSLVVDVLVPILAVFVLLVIALAVIG